MSMARRQSKSRVLVLDPIACDGHGSCAELFPEGIRLDDWGYPILRSGPIPEKLLSRARWAVSNCPALALRIEEAAHPAPRAPEPQAAPSSGDRGWPTS
jgi:ferredoxin